MPLSTSHTVLVVDNNSADLKRLSSILHDADYTVISGSSPEEAQELIHTCSPDIILLAVRLPGMKGFSLCQKLRLDEKFSDIPLIFVTSLAGQENILEGFNAGGNDYIVKPFSHLELLARVRNHLHLHDMLQKNKRLTERSEDSSSSKTEFLATMSHEIRTPLNSIIGMAEVLAETNLTSEQRNFVRIFRSAGESLLEIINDILDLSKIEAGQAEFEEIDFHLPSLLDSVTSILSVRAAEQSTLVTTIIHPNVPDGLRGDPTRLRQILINLVGNGLKFTENGTVEISVSIDSDHNLLFSIRDNGIGIPEEKQELIFESFTQADSLTTRKYGGTGLGLTICQKLTKIMGGRIWLKSMPGEGSTFFFTCSFIPALSDPLPSTGKSTPPLSCKILQPAHVLLVDDNEDNRNLLCIYLRNTPYTLKTAKNGEEAVIFFKQSAFDLVIMDIEMPILDGYEATKQLRQWEEEQRLEATPIIALTAHAFVRFREKCIEAGCSDYLTKPVRRDTLVRTISAHLNPGQDPSAQSETPVVKKKTVRGTDQGECPQVNLDPKIKKLIPRFLENKRNDAKRLLQTIETGDMEELARQAHAIKGTSWMYGFKNLGDTCLELEQAARNNDVTLTHKLALQVNDYLDKVVIRYIANEAES
jgi:signal transduction histidine kinase/HPt (histidine-containing phosphotransfer) domain-containing protein